MFARTAAFLLASAAFGALPAQAEIVQSSDTHFVSRHTVDVAAAPADVWLALIAPGEWWNDSHTWSADASNMSLIPQAGGCFCEKIPAEDEGETAGLEGSVQHMVVLQAVPRKVLRMRGGLGPLQSEPVDGVMTITLSRPEGVEGTRIVWEYVVGGTMRYEVPQISKAVDGVVGQQALGLAEALGGPIGEEEEPTAFDEAFGPRTEADRETPTVEPGEGR